MNWAEVTTQEELLAWVPEDFRLYPDVEGHYRLTGFERMGGCWWCGAELTGRQRKWCTRFQIKAEQGHWINYYNHFCWPYARNWCIERQGGHCANCGKYYGSFLEVHHIIPLEGSERQWTPFNLPWNLTGLCHACHLLVHAAMRPERLPLDSWAARIAAGQLPLYPELVNIQGEGGNYATVSSAKMW